MFKKDDYIVTLRVKDWNHDNCAKNNYCFKQRRDSKAIYPEIDLGGYSDNGHDVMSFDKRKRLLDWRYATDQEIYHYNLIGKPYDITTIKQQIYELW